MIRASAKKTDDETLAADEQEWYALYVMWAARSFCDYFSVDMACTNPRRLAPEDQAELGQWVDVAYVHLAEVELHQAGWIDSAAVGEPFTMDNVHPEAVLEALDGERPVGVTATALALYEDLLSPDRALGTRPAKSYRASALLAHEPGAGFCSRRGCRPPRRCRAA